MKKHAEGPTDATAEAIHLGSLLQRCASIKDVVENAKHDVAGRCLTELLETCGAVDTEGRQFHTSVAKAGHTAAMTKVEEHLVTSKKVVGDRARGLPLWALRISKDASWAQVQQEATLTLLKEDYIEKVKKLQTDLHQDFQTCQTRGWAGWLVWARVEFGGPS